MYSKYMYCTCTWTNVYFFSSIGTGAFIHLKEGHDRSGKKAQGGGGVVGEEEVDAGETGEKSSTDFVLVSFTTLLILLFSLLMIIVVHVYFNFVFYKCIILGCALRLQNCDNDFTWFDCRQVVMFDDVCEI